MWNGAIKIHSALCVAVLLAITSVDTAAAAGEIWVAKRTVPQLQYGEPIPWETADHIFPRKATAQIIDFETGLSFFVQRRAGSRHADVQPLSKEDSRIMKEIYSGKWSWRRRAVLVKVDGRFLAASMNGMPHGAGAISGNDFKGHFCLHFSGSSTHKHRKPDPGHQLMIYKASGKLHDVLASASPGQIADYFLTCIKEQDVNTLQLTMNQSDKQIAEEFTAKAASIENIRVLKKDDTQQPRDETANSVDIPVRLLMYMRPDNKKLQGDVILRVMRSSPAARWVVDAKPMLEFLAGDDEQAKPPAAAG